MKNAMKAKGFTLIETMIVVTVISVLATIAAPSFVATINATKARKTTDFVVQLVNFAKSEALNKNKDVYLSLTNTEICLSTKALADAGHTCNIRQDAIQSGSVITSSVTELKFDGIYGLPPPSVNTITVTYNGLIKTITLNVLGFITVT